MYLRIFQNPIWGIPKLYVNIERPCNIKIIPLKVEYKITINMPGPSIVKLY